MIANDNPIHTMDLMYENIGREDAVGLRLNFSSLPEYIRSVSIGREVRGRERERERERVKGTRRFMYTSFYLSFLRMLALLRRCVQ